MSQFECYYCKHSDRQFPCQRDPLFVGRAYAEGTYPSGRCSDEAFWSVDCICDAIHSDPEFAFTAILEGMLHLKTKEQAAVFAAGHLEDLIHGHGTKFITRIEQLARTSSRFQYILSGVWSQGNEETSVWKRIENARAGGPSIDEDDALPDI